VALLVGFCGVLIVANPDAGTFQVGALFALANAVLYGSVTVGVRGMTATESAETLILYQLALLTAFFALLLPLGWAWPTPADTALIVFNGVSNAARAAPGAGLGGGAVLLSLARMGEHAWLCDLGRRADHLAGDRVRRRGRVRSVPVVAREQRAADKAGRDRVSAPYA
jgi:hypothetical protein